MSRVLSSLLVILGVLGVFAQGQSTSLMITGVIDGPLSGGLPKAVELYTINDIPNLGIYGLGSANNGGGSDGQEYTFPSVAVSAGQYFYVATESTAFKAFFGFNPRYTHGQATLINGDDAIELFKDGEVVDRFGVVTQDGTGTSWEYKDGWAYRKSNVCPGTQFNPVEWNFSGPNGLKRSPPVPFPLCSFTITSGVANNCGSVQESQLCLEPPSTSLMITGVIDGPLSGGLPKAVELYAKNNIPNLAVYGLGSASNGGGSDGQEFTFPTVAVSAGQFIYVATESSGFNTFLGFSPTYTHAQATNINGDDAIELFKDGEVVDRFGVITQDGTGESWEYMDGWAYRASGSDPNVQFDPSEWDFSGPNALDGAANNANAAKPWPKGSFAP